MASVEELAGALGITPMAVRHHLNVLLGEALVAVPHVQRCGRPGRPRQIYQLAPAAESLFPDGSQYLSDLLLAELHASLPAEDWQDLVVRLAQRLIPPEVAAASSPSLEGKLARSAHYLRGLGVDLRWYVELAGGWMLRTDCPFDVVEHQGDWACDLHRAMLMRLLEVPEGALTWVAPCDEGCLYRLSGEG